MGKDTKIAWCDDTFNPWVGCMKISEACKHCYAAVSTPARTSRAKGLELWGPPATTSRKRTSAANWKLPLRWNREAIASGVRRRVFCASLADVFEAHPELDAIRADLWRLIEACAGLDWLLLTKRPENILRMVPPSWLASWPDHVWIGTTVESQASAEQRIPELLKVPARVRFLSMEPLLEAVDLSEWIACVSCCDRCGEECAGSPDLCPSCSTDNLTTVWGAAQLSRIRSGERYDDASEAGRRDIDGDLPVSWVIVGGESGPGARPFDLAWARSIVAQCREAGVPAFVKQLGARPVDVEAHCAAHPGGALDGCGNFCRFRRELLTPFKTLDRAGAAPEEWPEDLRAQEFPR